MRNKFITIVVAVSLLMTGCVPKHDDAIQSPETIDVAQTYSDNGIAIVPFVGGDPVRPVKGDTVLALTEWQVQNIQNGMRASGTTISLDDLDATAGSIPETVENTDERTYLPSELLLAWWGFAQSPRADLARAAYSNEALGTGKYVPLYVLVLFEADAFSDLGRTDAQQAVAAGDGVRTVAAGADTVFALDACGAVGQGIQDVGTFLQAIGVPPAVIGGAVEAAYGTINALSGGALANFQKVIGVINAVMTVSSLITPWKIEQTLSSPEPYQLGLNGKAGDGGVLVFSVTGVVGSPPDAVKSCLSLFGLKDPTSLEGTTFQIVANEVYSMPDSLGIAPSLISVDYKVGETRTLDENNTASISFQTGVQTIDTKDTEVETNFQSAWIYVLDIKRTDVGKISDWIRTALGGTSYEWLVGPSLGNIADVIEVAANPLVAPKYVPVSYLVPKKPPVGETGQQHDDAPPLDDPDVKEGIGDCLSVTYIEQLTGHTVAQHLSEPPATYATVPADAPITPLPPKNTCIYDLDNGWRLQIVWPYSIWDDGALDLFLVGNTQPAPNTCSRIANFGLLDFAGSDQAPETSSYVVWDGINLAATLISGKDSSQHKSWLKSMADKLNWCDRPPLLDWKWNEPNQ